MATIFTWLLSPWLYHMWVINPSLAIALDMSAKAHEWELDRSAAEMAERKGENAFATKC